MIIRILSDLHLEFGPISLPEVDADLVVLAGDVHIKRNSLAWIRDAFPDQPVIYIAGNHEFYGEKTPGLLAKLKADAAGTKVHVIENEVVEVNGWRFFGCTLWTDLALFGDPRVGAIEAMVMNDYRRIRHSVTYRRIKPADTRAWHLESVRRIRDFLAAGDPRRSVVVTHHAPSARSLPGDRGSDPVSCAYASHLDEWIESGGPRLWIHGHIHHSQDYRIGSTRVIANPHGYLDHRNPDFVPDLVIDLALGD
jgi:Icc-related predicted phosphoesterase